VCLCCVPNAQGFTKLLFTDTLLKVKRDFHPEIVTTAAWRPHEAGCCAGEHGGVCFVFAPDVSLRCVSNAITVDNYLDVIC
jgi:hypothetical protein